MDLSGFWQTLSESDLFAPQVVLQLQQASSETQSKPTKETICAELVAKKLLSPFQAQVLLSGRAGPFQFGNYTISQPVTTDSSFHQFKARHRKTQHPVLLDFLRGNDQPDLMLWRAIETTVQELEKVKSPHVLAFYESVTLPDYRFIVSQRPTGIALNQLSGRQARLSLKDTCYLFAQVAAAVEILHDHNLVHGRLCPASIWVSKKGLIETRSSLVANLPTEIRHSVDAANQTAPNDRALQSILTHFWLPGPLSPEFLSNPSESGTTPNPKNPDHSSDTRTTVTTKIEWTSAADWFQFGVCLLQSVQQSANNNKVNLPNTTTLAELRSTLQGEDPLLSLIGNLIDANPALRMRAGQQAKKMLQQQSGRSISEVKLIEPPTLAKFKTSLQPFFVSPNINSNTGFDSNVSKVSSNKKEYSPSEDSDSMNLAEKSTTFESATANADRSQPDGSADDRPVAIDVWTSDESASDKRPTHKNRHFELGAMAATILLFISMLAIISWIAAKQTGPMFVEQSENKTTSNRETIVATDDSIQSEIDTKLRRLAGLPESERPIVIQNLITDDRKTLWESPTEGAPLSDLTLPPAPKMIFVFRPQEMLTFPESELLARSMGADFLSLKKEWGEIAGVEWGNVQRLIVSLHTTPTQTYHSILFFEMESAIDRDQLLLNWNRPSEISDSQGLSSFVSADQQIAYRFLPDINHPTPNPSASATIANRGQANPNGIPDQPSSNRAAATEAINGSSDTVFRFAIGHPDLISQIGDHQRVDPMLGSLQALLDRTDRERHFNFVFLRPALFSEEGQKWMGERLATFNRQLSILIPDEILAATLSLHFDRGSFLEVKVVNSVNVKVDELRNLLEQRSRSAAIDLIDLAGSFPSNPYWNRLKARSGVMVTDLFRNFRWGVEHGEIVGNGWLPPGAAHNLMAGADLALSLSSGLNTTRPDAASERSVPTTLEEVLAIPRDLKVINPPDLNLLLADLQAEINDEYPSLGGRFRIKLMGPDLQLEGITQNQRPGALNIDHQPLSSILTQIMISANPSKEISGASDPNCKLVWVVSDDPTPEDPSQSNQPIILVTTRAAAQRQQLELPPPFRLEQ